VGLADLPLTDRARFAELASAFSAAQATLRVCPLSMTRWSDVEFGLVANSGGRFERLILSGD